MIGAGLLVDLEPESDVGCVVTSEKPAPKKTIERQARAEVSLLGTLHEHRNLHDAHIFRFA